MSDVPKPSTWIDLAGLPESVAESIRRLVEALRSPVDAPPLEMDHRPPMMGQFAHLMTGPGWTAEQFEEARREMNAEWEASLNAKYGVE